MLDPSKDRKRRRPVWEALSDIFLDTDVQTGSLKLIAEVLAQSGYSDEELQSILFREVYPVLISNLYHPAGIWDGFRLEWLEEQIISNWSAREHEPATPSDYWMIKTEWQKIREFLPQARCVQGPYHSAALDPRWLTSNVVDLAGVIYQENAFGRMPILADALMDVGCDSEEMLAHCRGPGPHVRGCWVVDLLLGAR